MAPSNAASAGRLAAASEAAARRARRLARTADLRQEQMIEDGERGGEGEAEGIAEAESGVEEDGGVTEPGIIFLDIIFFASASISFSPADYLKLYFYFTIDDRSSRTLPVSPPRNILASFLDRVNLQTRLWHPRSFVPVYIAVLAIRRAAAASAEYSFFQTRSNC